jgi:glycosyltransferase involved in cell wall biosynthesis
VSNSPSVPLARSAEGDGAVTTSGRQAAGASGVAPSGLLRAVVLFHESDLLGAGTAVFNAVEALSEFGWAVSGWVPGEGPLLEVATARLAEVACAERPLAVSIRGWREEPGVSARLRSTPRYLSSVRSALLRLRPHVVHANTLRALPEALVARRFGLPIVLHVHELPPPSAKRAAALQLASRIADVIVCVSEAVAVMVRRHARSTPVLVARNGVEAPAREVSGEAGARPFTVGTVGTVSRLKGTDVFFRAARLVAEQRPDVRFVHAGQGGLHRDRGLDDELRSLLASAPLDRAAGMLGRREAKEMLPELDLFVLPSRIDAFPLATLEAMAAGLPVIASRVGGIPEQITHLEHGVLVPPGDAEALAEWVVRLHDDEALRSQLAAAAADRARDEFTVSRQAAQLHRAYLVALNRRFGPPAVRAAALRAA